MRTVRCVAVIMITPTNIPYLPQGQRVVITIYSAALVLPMSASMPMVQPIINLVLTKVSLGWWLHFEDSCICDAISVFCG